MSARNTLDAKAARRAARDIRHSHGDELQRAWRVSHALVFICRHGATAKAAA